MINIVTLKFPFQPDVIGGDHECKSVNTIPTGIAQGAFPAFGENKEGYCGVHKVGISHVLFVGVTMISCSTK
jgi:hypothetical protein